MDTPARQATVDCFLVPPCPSMSMTSVVAINCVVASSRPESGRARPRRRVWCLLPTEPSLANPTSEVEFAMAKRRLSTFERLQRGQKLSRSERKEIERRFQREDPGLGHCA